MTPDRHKPPFRLELPSDRLIVALDYPAEEPALRLLDTLGSDCRWVKVGLELYLSAGPRIVPLLVDRGLSVFLDLKLHDIPNTVGAAVRALADCGAALLTLHGLGGSAMLEAAAAAREQSAASPRLLAVTVLTSMDRAALHAIGCPDTPEEEVLRLARLATAAGMDGLVCSPQEVATLRGVLGPEPLLVVPGIRARGGSPADDQSRTASAAETLARGASMLVVGRPITRSADPAAAFRALIEEMGSSGE